MPCRVVNPMASNSSGVTSISITSGWRGSTVTLLSWFCGGWPTVCLRSRPLRRSIGCLGCTAFMPPCSGVGKIICWWLDLRCIFAQCASSEVSMSRRNSQANFCAVCLGRCGINCDEQGVVLNALSVSCDVFEFEARSSDWCRSSKSASARLRSRELKLFDCISSPAHRQ